MKTLLFALGTLALIGCSGLKPVGPLAKDVPITQQGRPLPNTAPDPVTVPAVRPTPPTILVMPADVTADNPYIAASKLTNELSTDGKPTPNSPVTAEISRYKGGVKQN